MNVILQHALAYASNGWNIFPLSRAKIPFKGSRGHLDATTDPDQIRAWFDKPRPPNIGLACGVGPAPIAFDFDSPEALQTPWGASLMRAAAANGGLPETLTQITRRGFHALYLPPAGVEIRTRNEPRGSKGGPGLDIRGLGGYIVLTPSISDKGHVYSWRQMRPPTVMPDWLVGWIEELGGKRPERSQSIIQATLGPAPAYLSQPSQRDITANARRTLENTYSAHEEARLRGALAAIPITCGHDQFVKIGFALHSLDWERSDGTSIAYEIWEDWCSKSEHFNPAGLEQKWAEIGRSSRGEVSLGTIFQYAKEAGWRGDVALSAAAAQALSGPSIDFARPTINAVVFKDTNRHGGATATTLNAFDAIAALNIRCWHDIFHDKKYLGGELINQWAGQLSDGAVLMVRKLIRSQFGFDPGNLHARDAAEQHALANQVNPVTDYLDGLRWDGSQRIGRWLINYMGAADTALNRAIGRLVLIAAVRRARHPGTKFDQILVMEGPEGKGKSSAIQILAGRENFSDAPILGLNKREQQEALSGVWLYEIAELAGMRKSEVESIKAFASRESERARPAFGHYVVSEPRRCIFIATTNDDRYLKSETGNRRFWPVLTAHVDLDALRRDRDQLWAEATELEAKGASVVLDESLWGAAAEEQEKRREDDPWLERIEKYVFDAKNQRRDVTTTEVLCDNPYVQLHAGQINDAMQRRAAACLKRLGFDSYQKKVDGKNTRRWKFEETGAAAPFNQSTIR